MGCALVVPAEHYRLQFPLKAPAQGAFPLPVAYDVMCHIVGTARPCKSSRRLCNFLVRWPALSMLVSISQYLIDDAFAFLAGVEVLLD